ncbi:hypothetical protein CY35_03G072800 [Sphagnum magellanicum]|nr:hypothetical protein CY35_03G072800 [Sphagnum magellanicum]
MASLPLPSSPAFLPSSSSSSYSSSHSLAVTIPSHFYLRQRFVFCNSLISQRIRSSSFGEARGKEVRRRCGRVVEDIRELEQRQDMGEMTTATSTVSTVASSSGTAAATVGSTDMYAAIPTLPIAAALAAAGSETAELNGGTCGLLDRPDKKQVCLFYCSETEDLARRIAAETDSIELKSIRWGTFADGFPNLFVPNAHGIRSQHVAFLASFSSPGVIFEQLSIIYALPRMFVSSFTLVLPFFPTGTLERMEDEGDVATAFTLARILSNIPISRGGPTSLVIFDIHALQERFYFGDNVLPCFESGIPLLKHRLHQLPDANNISIAFPDEGAWKRFHKQLQHFPTIICTKVRDGNNRIVRLKEGEPQGRHVVIVDDLVQSGGTLTECQKLLGANGASKVSAYVTHAVFPKRSWERFEHDNGA